MSRRFLTLLFCLAGAAALRAEPPSLLDPATLIADPAHDPAWQDLLARLAPGKNRLCAFVERRYFPFRRTPIVLTGEVRIAPDLGLSLHYLTPEPRIVIVDGRGLLIRDASGREQAVPADGRALAAVDALVDVLRFDLPRLQKNFAVHGWREAGVWTLALVPRNPSLASSLSAVMISGEQMKLGKIELIESAAQRVEILIGETREGVTFSADELARYFR
ncbi:MAG TPA: outer membrane lipoprotein carrier protein LolA [Opitutaceae bacterium]|nr:outer membrane lipoprotein carrier protein LolA [Opitutaceae bacterium]